MAVGGCILGLFYCFWFESAVEPARLEQMTEINWAHKATAALMVAVSLLVSLAAQSIPFLYFQF